MPTNYSLDRPPSQPKPYRVSKIIDKRVMSSDGLNPIQIQNETEPKRNQCKKETTIGLQIAEMEVAIQRANLQSNLYYKGKQVPITIDQQHFKIYGPGIYLFFAFIWKISILFLILTFISLLPMIYNYLAGTKFSQSVNSMSVFIARLSIGNFYGDDSSLTSDQQIASTRVPKLINCVSDLVSMFLVMLFYFYWTWKSDRIIEQIKKNFNLPNYHTLQLTKFHQDTTDNDVYTFFNQFGMVNEVAPVKNYSETIKLSKEIFQCETKIKSLLMDSSEQQLLSNQKNNFSLNSQNQNNSVVEISPRHNEKILKLKENLRKLYKELYEEQKKSKEQTIKYYVSFESPLQRANALKQFNKVYDTWCLCLETIPQKYMLKGQHVEVKACHNQPGEIIWQNVHITWKTRWMRALLQFVVLLVIICLGYLVISSLDEISPPSTYESIDTSSYTSESILLQSNETIVQSWCLKNTAVATSTSQSLTQVCQPYINLYYLNLVIIYAITVFVIVIKTLIKKVVIWIAKFQRYTSHTSESIDVIKNLVIIYIITTVLIGFLLQADLFGIQFKNIVPNLLNNSTMKENAALMTDYSVLLNQWYVDIGYQIWLTWLILSLSPHTYMPLYHYFIQWLNNKLAKTQKLQSAMDAILLPAQFQLQDHYANIIMIFFVAIIFCGGIPSMIIVSFVGIITRYCYLKFLFIRFSRVPKSIDEHLNIAVLSYIPWALGGHFLMTIWMYNVSSVFAFEQSIFSQWVINYYNSTSSGFVQFISKGLQMMVGSYYYTIVAILIMVSILIKQLIYDFFIRVFRNSITRIQQQQVSSAVNQLVHKNKNPILISHRGITNSYMIENNPNYFEILSIKNQIKIKIQNGDFQSSTANLKN